NVYDSQIGLASADHCDSTVVERRPTLGECHAARVGFYRRRLGGFVLGFWEHLCVVQTLSNKPAQDSRLPAVERNISTKEDRQENNWNRSRRYCCWKCLSFLRGDADWPHTFCFIAARRWATG